MINKDNINKIILDVEGSSYIRFETDLDLENESLGDFYWQGEWKFFEVNMLDLLNNRDEEFQEEWESIEKFLSEDAIEYINHLWNYELKDFIY